MKINAKQVRSFAIEDTHAENLFISMSLSSEAPYLRSFGNEILLHGDSNIDMSRTMPNGLPLLVNHNSDSLPIGRLKNIRLDPETRKLRGDAYFSGRPEAQMVRQDILDGVLGDVSIGYKILDYNVEKAINKDEPNNVYVSRWLPLEGSICAIPADNTVGVGRTDSEEIEIDLDRKEEPKEEEVEPSKEIEAEATEEAKEDPKEESTETPKEEIDEEDLENNKNEENTNKDLLSEELSALRNVALNLKLKSEVEIDQILQTRSLDDARNLLLKTKPTSVITSSYKERKMFNQETLNRGLAQALKGDFSNLDESLAGVIKQTGVRNFEADLFTRANEMTTAAKGTNTIYDQNIGFLEILRARTAVLNAGAKTRTGNGALSYIRQKTAVAATLRGENTGTTTNTFADFEKVSYIPKALTAKVYLTDELQKESIVDLQNILRGDMVKQFAIAIDNFAINGNASPAIVGLMSAGSNINVSNLGAPALPTFAKVNLLKALVDQKAVDLASCAYLVTPSLLGVLETTAKLTNGSAIAENNKINGYAAYSSANVPVATLNHTMLFGDFSQMEICLQGPTEFMIDTQSRFDEGITILTARQYFDIGILQPSAFASTNNFLVA